MDFNWTEEQRLWRRAVRDFAQNEIAPRVREIDTAEHIPSEIVKGMAEVGLLAPLVGEEYGGAGADWTMAAIAAEELGRADISLAVPVLYLVEAAWGFIFYQYGTPELKEEYLPQVTRGDAFLGIATTEPGGGSDILGACRTRAVRDNDEWMFNGEKVFISGVRESLEWGGIHLMLARTEPDPAAGHRAFTFFAIPLKGTEGITPTFFEDMGRMGISTGGFAMEDVRLPAHHQVGEFNRGFYHAMEGFSAARTLIGATCVGAAQAVLDMGIDQIQQREAFGRPLASFEGIQFPLADLYAELEGVRLITYKAAWTMDQKYKQEAATHHDIALAAAMAKMRAPLVGFEVMNEVANWFGAMAYTKECPIEMGIRGIRSYSIGAEGTINVMRMIIARELLGQEFLPTAYTRSR
ncbi:MAG: acyl-CoA dehydrogenase family protein [Chloroflexota bacterium]|nr:acyl-CoA dehydrogenase family protein [Chloroflexota bacterium]